MLEYPPPPDVMLPNGYRFPARQRRVPIRRWVELSLGIVAIPVALLTEFILFLVSVLPELSVSDPASAWVNAPEIRQPLARAGNLVLLVIPVAAALIVHRPRRPYRSLTSVVLLCAALAVVVGAAAYEIGMVLVNANPDGNISLGLGRGQTIR